MYGLLWGLGCVEEITHYGLCNLIFIVCYCRTQTFISSGMALSIFVRVKFHRFLPTFDWLVFYSFGAKKKHCMDWASYQLSPDHFFTTPFVCFTGKRREIKGSENRDNLSGQSSLVFFIQIYFSLHWMPRLDGQQSCYFVFKQQRNFSVVMSGKCLPSKREIASSTAYWLSKLISCQRNLHMNIYNRI